MTLDETHMSHAQRTAAVMLLRLRDLQPNDRRDALAALLRNFPEEVGELLGIVLQPIPGGIQWRVAANLWQVVIHEGE